MQKPIDITLGMQVKFDSEHGPQQGNVVGIHPHHIIVEVAGGLQGCHWKVERTQATPVCAAA